ncbi:MAG: PIF1 family ATP-dependent DNA helicase [Balneolaceae bacterium]|nr:PIF1 family ATP-dependent DNA helicase [Balneolaceae bacterium]
MSAQNPRIQLPDEYPNDPFLEKLFQRINSSRENFIITGKAGTGKSTFLHYLAENAIKSSLVTAFSGIAAINVGGMTLHSLFLFPFKPMLPNDDSIKEFRSGSQRQRLLEKVDMIIIDELSMLRSDVFQAIDHSLRLNTGNRYQPFGGKQLVLFGDIFQLPPVVQNDPVEQDIFSNSYDSEYFFDAPVFEEADFNFVEMFKVYRQEDTAFVHLLNRVRTGLVDQRHLEQLNKRYAPGYLPGKEDYVVTLTTTNRVANNENNRRLELIDEPSYRYHAELEGEFPKDRFPTDQVLELKEGAQVIFIKNDLEGRRWVNGSIAKIEHLEKDSISVRLENGEIHELGKETWHNIKYKYNKRRNRVEEEVKGSFIQYPVKLAWAMTIHKSQGLTFDQVFLDLGRGAFVNGQLYVGLSRCTSFNGLYLKKKITRNDIIKDPRLLNFYKKQREKAARESDLMDIQKRQN